jgi:hypothetical protein
MVAFPAVATSNAAILTTIWFEETDNVRRGNPFHSTMERLLKLAPLMVRSKEPLPATTLAGETPPNRVGALLEVCACAVWEPAAKQITRRKATRPL